jgi:hypothetical protein
LKQFVRVAVIRVRPEVDQGPDAPMASAVTVTPMAAFTYQSSPA